MKWSDEAWHGVEVIYQKIIHMPFNEELMKGTLARNRFRFYMQQDALYLTEFSRALSLIAARSFQYPYGLDFIRFAEGALVVERSLHEGYFTLFGVTGAATASPACQSYTQFLLCKAALDSVEVAMAAVLPCFWIYQKAGNFIYANGLKKDNPYSEWINTYAGEEFGRLVQKAIDICDEVAATCSAAQQQRMREAFTMASKLEWMFWDSAYRLEEWPV